MIINIQWRNELDSLSSNSLRKNLTIPQPQSYTPFNPLPRNFILKYDTDVVVPLVCVSVANTICFARFQGAMNYLVT